MLKLIKSVPLLQYKHLKTHQTKVFHSQLQEKQRCFGSSSKHSWLSNQVDGRQKQNRQKQRCSWLQFYLPKINLYYCAKSSQLSRQTSTTATTPPPTPTPTPTPPSSTLPATNNNNSNTQKDKKEQEQVSTNPTTEKKIFSLKSFLIGSGGWTFESVFAVGRLLFFGTGLYVLLGTTTLLSVLIWLYNVIPNEEFQETVLRKVTTFITQRAGIDIRFDSWKGGWREGTIQLLNVTIKRDPNKLAPQNRNCALIDLEVNQVDLKVSLLWFVEGKGLIKELYARGVRGEVDRRHIDFSGPEWPRISWHRGDFELDRLELKDVEVKLFNPNPTRELVLKIFTAECDQVRRQWLLYDILSAKSIVGTFDGSLFSLHRAQEIRKYQELTSILKIDGVNMDLISRNCISGPLSWITEGAMDIEAELIFHTDTLNYYYYPSGEKVDPKIAPDPGFVKMQVHLNLNNLHAKPPLVAEELSYIENAVVKPVIAYMNRNYTKIPLDFVVNVSTQNFNGSWTPGQAGLWSAISKPVGEEFEKLVLEQQKPSNLSRHWWRIVRSFNRALLFIWRQVKSYYELWYFANQLHDEEGRKELFGDKAEKLEKAIVPNLPIIIKNPQLVTT